jgi:hypothetical protein
MPKFDLTRRQFVNSSMATLGMFGINGLSNFVLADEPEEFEEVAKFLRTGQSKIPYITMTDDGPVYPTAEIPWLSDFTAVGGKGKRPPGQLVFCSGNSHAKDLPEDQNGSGGDAGPTSIRNSGPEGLDRTSMLQESEQTARTSSRQSSRACIEFWESPALLTSI